MEPWKMQVAPWALGMEIQMAQHGVKTEIQGRLKEIHVEGMK
jgi:hypothetical protein